MGCSPHVWRQNGVGQELNRQKQRHPSVFRPTAAIAEPHLLLLAQDVAERALLERQLRHLDLNDTLRNTVKMLERLVGEHVQIDFYPQESLPAIHADPSMLEQIA